jgi:hypothetical protein
MAKEKNFIKKGNYNRVLLTETLPYETPIIFSNEGLYKQLKLAVNDCKKKASFKKKLLDEYILKEKQTTKPFFYQIRKNELEFRRLALLHPCSQNQIKKFYQKNDQLIIYFCTQSPASLRSPKAVASRFYINNSRENKYRTKTQNKTLLDDDIYTKHMLSYFAYHGYTRIYKFYSSKEYFTLERKFPVQMTLDVSKCFDSIYTHSIGWATKSKEFIKSNLHKYNFGDKFDSVLRSGNDNETKGIVIGPEVSRIFAEIIFQKIDVTVINNLREKNLSFDQEYTFRRYVDDVFIFAHTEEITKQIYTEYVDILWKFNLQVNEAKTAVSQRPFVSTKTRLIHEAKKILDTYFDKLVEKDSDGKKVLAKIIYPEKFIVSFIAAIKSLCIQNKMKYADIASYIISVLKGWLYKLTKIHQKPENAECGKYSDTSHQSKRDDKQDIDKNYYNAVSFISEVAFFLYSVAPTVNSSYTLSKIIIHMIDSVAECIPSFKEAIENQIYHLTCQLFLSKSKQPHIAHGKVVYLELLNIMLAVRKLGNQYQLPESMIEELFWQNKYNDYFSIISILYYIKNNTEYANLRENIIKYIQEKLSDMNDLGSNSEKMHLLLDTLSCPYISRKVRTEWVEAVMKKIGFEGDAAEQITDEMESSYWFVNWSEKVDLLNFLVKKKSRQVY